MTTVPGGRCLIGGDDYHSSLVNQDVFLLYFQISLHDTCKLDQLLKYFLTQCVSDGEDRSTLDKEALLEQCLNKVLPICNDEEMRAHLQNYCTSWKSNNLILGRRVSFIDLCNYALGELSVLDLPHLRGPSSNQILFHHGTNIPTLDRIQQDALAEGPYIIVTSLASARRASIKHGDTSWNGAVKDLCWQPPSKGFAWPDILSAVEMDSTAAAIAGPPGHFDTSSHVREAQKPKNEWLFSVHDQMSGESNTRIQLAQKALEQSQTRCGTHATDMLSSALCSNHAINLHIVDDVASIWWYDHQGIIRSEAMNFIQDLPRFLVLLLAFQRFTLEDWGINTMLNPKARDIHDAAASNEVNATIQASPFKFQFPASGENKGAKVEINPKELLHSRWSLRGRATRVVGASSQSLHPITGDSLDHVPLVVKLSWPETWRWSEQTVLARAKACGKGNRDVENHLPDLICSYDLGYSTGTIRKAVGVSESEHSPKEPRVLRVTLYRRLYPLTMLGGEQFVAAWLGCVRCHYVLWTKGVRHNDPSLANLMLRRTNDKYYGVLNDWDLATVVGESPDTKRGVLTGTVPFMAQDELFKLAVKQSDTRIYRYDLEAFIWILLWVCVRYQDTRLLPNPELSHWKSFDFGGIASSKQAYIDHEWRERHAVRPTKSWENEWRLVWKLLDWLEQSFVVREAIRRRAADRFHGGGDDDDDDDAPVETYEEPSDDVTYLSFMAVLTEVGQSVASLSWLLNLVPPVKKRRLRKRATRRR